MSGPLGAIFLTHTVVVPRHYVKRTRIVVRVVSTLRGRIGLMVWNRTCYLEIAVVQRKGFGDDAIDFQKIRINI